MHDVNLFFDELLTGPHFIKIIIQMFQTHI